MKNFFLFLSILILTDNLHSTLIEYKNIDKNLGVIHDGLIFSTTMFICADSKINIYNLSASSWTFNQQLSLDFTPVSIIYEDVRKDGLRRIYTGTFSGIYEIYFTGSFWEYKKIFSSSYTVNDILYFSINNSSSIFSVLENGSIYRTYYLSNDWRSEEIARTGLEATSITAADNSLFISSKDSYIYKLYYKDGFVLEKIYKTYAYLTSLIYYRDNNIEYIISSAEDSNIYYLTNSSDIWIKKSIYTGKGALYYTDFSSNRFIFSGENGYLGVYEIENKYLKLSDEITFQNRIYWATYDKNTDNYIAGGEDGIIYTATEISSSSVVNIEHRPYTMRKPLFPFPDEEITLILTNYSEGLKQIILHYKVQDSTFYYEINSNTTSITLSLSYSSGTVIDYFFTALYSNTTAYIYAYESKLSGTLYSKLSFEKDVAEDNPFKFIIGGKGEASHEINSMRTPIYPAGGDEIILYVKNLASGSGNYGNMIGGSLFYTTDSSWNEVYLSWDRDEGNYKFWKAELTLSDYTDLKYYFKVNYDDHLTTYVFGDNYSSFSSTSEAVARDNPFSIDTNYSLISGTITSPSGKPLTGTKIRIFRNNTLILLSRADEYGYYSVKLPTGTYDIYITSAIYQGERFILKISSYTSFTKNQLLYPVSLPREIDITGNLYIDFTENELVSSDSLNDSNWGNYNEVGDFYVSWSSSSLYLGFEGRLDNNSILLYIDVGDWYGNIEDANNLPWGTARNHFFPEGFYPDYQIYTWNFDFLNFYRITSSTTLTDITSDVLIKIFNVGEKHSMAVVDIPFDILYEGYVKKGLPAGATVQFILCMSGGEGSSAHDTNPNQQAGFGYNWYDPFNFDTFIRIPLDIDLDNTPDSETIRGWPFRDFSPPPTPSNLDIEVISSSAIRLLWDSITADDFSHYGIYISTEKDKTGTLIYNNITTNEISLSLSSKATYFFRVFSVDKNNNQSPLSEAVSVSIISYPLVIHSPVERFNYPGKELPVQATFSSDVIRKKLFFKNYIQDSYTSVDFVSDKAIIPADYTEKEKIYYYIWSENLYGKTSVSASPSSPHEITIVSSETQNIDISDYTTLTLYDGRDPPTRINISPETFYRNTSLKVRFVSNWDALNEGNFGIPDEKLYYPVIIYEINPLQSSTLRKPLEIILKYFDEDISGVDENKLYVFRYDSKKWEYINSSHNTDENTFTFNTKLTGKFAVFEVNDISYYNSSISYDGLIEIKNSIFIPSSEIPEIRTLKFIFENTADIPEIKIFDTCGREIRKLEGEIEWDGKDRYGRKVASGIYIYQFKLKDRIITGECVLVR